MAGDYEVDSGATATFFILLFRKKMLEEMRTFVLKNRNGNDVQRYYAGLVMELISKVGDGEEFLTVGKERVAISDVFLDIKKAVRG